MGYCQKLIFLLFFIFVSPLYANGPIEKRPYCEHEIIEHTYYTLCFNEEWKQAHWVYYELTKEEVEDNKVRRKNNFRTDPKITNSVHPFDYRNSGYDRGHLAPAADMRFCPIAMNESFFMSNMSPQIPELNRKEWAKLENHARELAIENESILIYTGPVLLHEPKELIGESEVGVPFYYYKIVELSDEKRICFALPNEDAKSFEEHEIDCLFLLFILNFKL